MKLGSLRSLKFKQQPAVFLLLSCDLSVYISLQTLLFSSIDLIGTWIHTTCRYACIICMRKRVTRYNRSMWKTSHLLFMPVLFGLTKHHIVSQCRFRLYLSAKKISSHPIPGRKNNRITQKNKISALFGNNVATQCISQIPNKPGRSFCYAPFCSNPQGIGNIN